MWVCVRMSEAFPWLVVTYAVQKSSQIAQKFSGERMLFEVSKLSASHVYQRFDALSCPLCLQPITIVNLLEIKLVNPAFI